MGSFLGYINLILIAIMLLMFPIKLLLKNKNISKQKISGIYKSMRVFHPVVGILILVIGFIHGYFKIGRIYFHNGTYILIVVLIMGFTSFLRKKSLVIKRNFIIIHRFLAVIVMLLILYHLWWKILMLF